MPRIARGFADGHFYHIINRGNARQQVFHKDEDYIAFVDLMQESVRKYEISLYAYCVMPNHFHILVSPKTGAGMSKWMQWFMTSHVRRYHRHYRSSGHVWQGRFKSFPVQDDGHLLTVARYIEANPVRAALAATAAEWQWSSHLPRIKAENMTLAEMPIKLPEEWTRYVDEPMKESELERVRTSVRRQSPLGWPRWQRGICETLGLGSTMNPVGRPGKWGQEK